LVELKEIMDYAEKTNTMISKDALPLLASVENWKKIMEEISAEGSFMINESILEKKLMRTKMASAIPDDIPEIKNFDAQAKDRAPNFRILEEYDVTNKSLSRGKVSDFLRMFRSKFEILGAMLRTRHSLHPVEIQIAKKMPNNASVDIIAMVTKKWITKNGHLALQVEDLGDNCIAMALKKEQGPMTGTESGLRHEQLKKEIEVFQKAERIIEDNVVGIKGVRFGNGMLIIKELYWPDIQSRPPKLTKEDVLVGSLTDIHVGSKLFYKENFERCLDYINGKGVEGKELEKLGKMQYLLITGDNVAGVGVYPGQYDELVIKDIYAQYAAFEELMLRIPDYIQVFITPGNHDASRRAEPQPALSAEFFPKLSKKKNFHFIGSPSWIEIEGVKILLYHGPSVHDLISSTSFFSMSKPEEAMVELLKKRDLMPKYGGKNPYVPEEKDYMVIKEEPDLIYFGDVHHKGYAYYKGTTIINSGCWEGQTDFQKKIGHVPTPGTFPIINLKDRSIVEKQFVREGDTEIKGME
jgi:DNA polymerase II small subunit